MMADQQLRTTSNRQVNNVARDMPYPVVTSLSNVCGRCRPVIVGHQRFDCTRRWFGPPPTQCGFAATSRRYLEHPGGMISTPRWTITDKVWWFSSWQKCRDDSHLNYTSFMNKGIVDGIKVAASRILNCGKNVHLQAGDEMVVRHLQLLPEIADHRNAVGRYLKAPAADPFLLSAEG